MPFAMLGAQNLNEIASLGFGSKFHPETVTIFSDNLQATDYISVQDVVT